MTTDSRDYYKAKYQKIEDLPGIGPATATTLRNLGYHTVEALATASVREIIKGGVGESTAKKVVEAARKSMEIRFVTGAEFYEMRKNLKQLTLGCSSLDRLFNGGLETQSITEFFGEFGCHSEDTMVLTPQGIGNWRDHGVGDKIYGMEDGKIVETEIVAVQEFPYSGSLFQFASLRYNLCVTPNHDVYFRTINDRSIEKDYEKIEAQAIKKQGYFKVAFDYDGIKKEFFDLQEYIVLPHSAHPEKSRAKALLPPLETRAFCRLVGYYIGNGSPLRTPYATYPQIRQFRNREKLKSLLEELALDYSIYEDTNFVIFHRDLGQYLLRCGAGAPHKKIPSEIFELDRKALIELYRGLMSTDGTKTGFTYSSSSRTLAEQFLILLLKIGRNGSLRKRDARLSYIHGHEVKSIWSEYYINCVSEPIGYYEVERNLEHIEYEGSVWCYTTRTGNFFTIRDGVPTLSGNSGKSQLCQQLAVTVQLPEAKGGLDGGCLYLDTEHVFRPERVMQIAGYLGMDPHEALQGIVFAEAYSSDHQVILLEAADEIIKEHNIRLIVVDSLTGHWRSDYIGRENLAPRQQNLNVHMHKLMKLARGFNAVVAVTNQVLSTPDLYSGSTPSAIGGHIVGHISHSRTYLRKGKNNLRIAKIVASPFLPIGEAPFSITDRGIEGDDL